MFDRKAYYVEWRRRRRVQVDRLLHERKAVPCSDCGLEFPYCVMQFDHTRDEKEHRIADLAKMVWMGRKSFDVLLAELDKCDVVCANCHCIRSDERGQILYRTQGGTQCLSEQV